MKDTLEELERWGADVIFGRARGFKAALARIVLRGFAWLFRAGVQFRLARYRSGARVRHFLGTRVVAIGNITVGGTGKTPVTELLSRELRDRGRKVAILSRGYKSKPLRTAQKWTDARTGKPVPPERMPRVVSTGTELLLDSKHAGDEPFMLARNLDGVAVVVGKDRVKSAHFAISNLDTDLLLLDDGMQYLDLAHSWDIVLIDSTAPFGTGAMLPRGTLREPPKNLRRATYILLTKCDGSSNEDLVRKIRKYNKVAKIIETTHGPVHLENVFTRERKPLSHLDGKYVGAISAIAVPESFERSLAKLGAKVEITRRFADHHRFSKKDVEKFMHRCIDRDLSMMVTTEKDAVRFPTPSSLDVPVYFLRIEVRILAGQEHWNEMIDRLCHVEPVFDYLARNREALAV